MSKITAHILGTTAGVPTKERGHTAIYLSHYDREEFSCLFDCGENTQRQLTIAGLNIMKIDDCFITHWHGDHCLGLPGLVDTMGFEDRQRPLTVYAPEAGRIKKSLDSSYSMRSFKVLRREVPKRGNRIVTLLEKDRFRIVSVPVDHNIPAVAYALVEKDRRTIDLEKAGRLGLPEQDEIYARIKKNGEVELNGRRIKLEDISAVENGKKVVFSGDTGICQGLRKLARGADLLIQDCTYFSEEDAKGSYKHASLNEVIRMVEEEGIKRTVLTHISRKYQDMDHLRSLVEPYGTVEVAEDFAIYEV